MNRTAIPTPPDPSSAAFAGNPQLWQKAAYQWMLSVKQAVDTDRLINTRPTGKFLVSTYTAVNTMAGTDALSNVVATLITDMMGGGYLTTPRNLA